MDTLSQIWVELSSSKQRELEQDARISKASSALQLRGMATAETDCGSGHERAQVLELVGATPQGQLDELQGVPLVASALCMERFLAQLVAVAHGDTSDVNPA